MGLTAFILNVFRTLLVLLVASTTYAQSVYRLNASVQRTPINHHGPTISEDRKVLIVIEGGNYGVFDGYDTLYLVPSKDGYEHQGRNYPCYQDIEHDNQNYNLYVIKNSSGFVMFVTPLKPFNRRLYSITISL